MAIRRKNAIFHRMSRMKGLPADEKMLLQRIGNLMDAALNNRQTSNPYGPSKNQPDRVLYPPTGLVAYTGYRTLKLVWTAPDSDQHSHYEIKITNNETGEHETKTSYTNELTYKNVNGAYTATVKSVGLDSSSSPIQTLGFTMGGSVMQIEGSKNGPTELGTMVKDTITIYNNYSVYSWGSVVLDKYTAGSSNEPAVFRLWSMEGENRIFDVNEAYLQQTVTLYPASESFADLDDNARAAEIYRPIAPRPGSFETSQSVMFSPIAVETEEESIMYTFFLEALGRETELDEVNLSLVLWGGFDGLGDQVPQDPWDGGKTPYVFPHLNSLRVWRRETSGTGAAEDPVVVNSGSFFLAEQAKQYNVIDNAWTVACWVRLESEHTNVMLDNIPPNRDVAAENWFFSRSSYMAVADYDWNKNAIQIGLSASEAAGQPYNYQNITVKVGDINGNLIECSFQTQTFGESHTEASDNDDDSYLWNQGPGYDWIFLVVCYEGGPDTTGISYTPKIRVYQNCRQWDGDNTEDRFEPANGMECLNQRVADGKFVTDQYVPALLLQEHNQDLSQDYVYSIGAEQPTGLYQLGAYLGPQTEYPNGTISIHQIGMWNVALDNWDGKNFNPGVAESKDTSPYYDPEDPNVINPYHTDGRENQLQPWGSSLTAIHYLYNSMYGTDIDWKKNSNFRADGAQEYPFAENLVHLWQFGAVNDEFSDTAETLRDTGNFLYGGGVNFLRDWTGTLHANANGIPNLWREDTKLSDIFSPVRMPWEDPNAGASSDVRGRLPPLEWRSEGEGDWDAEPLVGRPSWTDQEGTVQPTGHLNGAGYPDAGTTSSRYAYPGLWGCTAWANGGAESGLSHWENIAWARPNTTNGVLDEPKTFGPVWVSASRAQAEIDTGQDPWP